MNFLHNMTPEQFLALDDKTKALILNTLNPTSPMAKDGAGSVGTYPSSDNTKNTDKSGGREPNTSQQSNKDYSTHPGTDHYGNEMKVSPATYQPGYAMATRADSPQANPRMTRMAQQGAQLTPEDPAMQGQMPTGIEQAPAGDRVPEGSDEVHPPMTEQDKQAQLQALVGYMQTQSPDAEYWMGSDGKRYHIFDGPIGQAFMAAYESEMSEEPAQEQTPAPEMTQGPSPMPEETGVPPMGRNGMQTYGKGGTVNYYQSASAHNPGGNSANFNGQYQVSAQAGFNNPGQNRNGEYGLGTNGQMVDASNKQKSATEGRSTMGPDIVPKAADGAKTSPGGLTWEEVQKMHNREAGDQGEPSFYGPNNAAKNTEKGIGMDGLSTEGKQLSDREQIKFKSFREGGMAEGDVFYGGDAKPKGQQIHTEGYVQGPYNYEQMAYELGGHIGKMAKGGLTYGNGGDISNIPNQNMGPGMQDPKDNYIPLTTDSTPGYGQNPHAVGYSGSGKPIAKDGAQTSVRMMGYDGQGKCIYEHGGQLYFHGGEVWTMKTEGFGSHQGQHDQGFFDEKQGDFANRSKDQAVHAEGYVGNEGPKFKQGGTTGYSPMNDPGNMGGTNPEYMTGQYKQGSGQYGKGGATGNTGPFGNTNNTSALGGVGRYDTPMHDSQPGVKTIGFEQQGQTVTPIAKKGAKVTKLMALKGAKAKGRDDKYDGNDMSVNSKDENMNFAEQNSRGNAANAKYANDGGMSKFGYDKSDWYNKPSALHGENGQTESSLGYGKGSPNGQDVHGNRFATKAGTGLGFGVHSDYGQRSDEEEAKSKKGKYRMGGMTDEAESEGGLKEELCEVKYLLEELIEKMDGVMPPNISIERFSGQKPVSMDGNMLSNVAQMLGIPFSKMYSLIDKNKHDLYPAMQMMGGDPEHSNAPGVAHMLKIFMADKNKFNPDRKLGN